MRFFSIIIFSLQRWFYFFLCLFAFIYFIACTSAGLQVLFIVSNPFIPGKLIIQDLQGKLISNVTLHKISYINDNYRISIDHLNLSWQPFYLLTQKMFLIQSVEIDGVEVHQLQNNNFKPDQKTDFRALIIWFKHFILNKLILKEVIISTLNNSPIQIDEFRIENNENNVHSMILNSSIGTLKGEVRLNWLPYLNWNIVLYGNAINPGNIYSQWQGRVNFLLNSQGMWRDGFPEFHFQLNQLNGMVAGYPVNGIGNIHLKKNELDIQQVELRAANSVLKLSGKHKNNWDILWQLTIPKLNLISPNANGSLLSSGSITGKTTQPEIKGTLQVPELSILVDKSKKAADLILKNLNADVIGKVNFNEDLIKSKYAIAVASNDSELIIPRLHISLTRINMKTAFNSQQPIHVSGSFKSNQSGEGQFNGEIDINHMGYPLTFNLEGTNLEVAHLPEYKIFASPKLTLIYSNVGIALNGNINIPKAKITLKDFSTVTTLPSEVEFVDDTPKQSKSDLPLNLTMNVQLNLGKDIYFAYENLSTTLAGNLLITQLPNTLPKATGELEMIKGKYSAYGKELLIRNGRLIYTGNNLTNPGLDIRAAKKIKLVTTVSGKSQFETDAELESTYSGSEKTTVGLWIQGTLNDPYTTFYSDPPGLNQKDILSYLLFGYPQSQIKDADKLTLLAQASMSQVGPGKITKKVKKVLGLSELSLGSAEYFDAETNSISNATVVNIGKKFGKKISLHYSVGVFNPISILSLKYQINKRLALKSETSKVDTGADLVYEYERD